MRILDGVKLDFDDVAIVPKRSALSSRSEVNLLRKFKTLNSCQEFEVLPVIAANLDSTGVFAVAKELAKHRMMTCLHKFYAEDDLVHFGKNNEETAYNYVFYTLGMRKGDYCKFENVYNKFPYRFVMIDVPNGYIRSFYDYVKRFRDNYPNVILGAGNVVTDEAVQDLILDCGVDICKCGIASGGLCGSKNKTGIYYPQLSVCIECSDKAHGLGGLIISDGGVKEVGHIAKALCGNADMVMCGSYFCGIRENSGEIVSINGKDYFKAYGMSSDIAINKYYGGEGLNKYRTSEGKTKLIEFKGSANDVCLDIIGGLNSTATYIGAKDIKDFGKAGSFIRIR